MNTKYKLQVIKTLLQGARTKTPLRNDNIIDKPIIFEFMITSKCNAYCQMCNIWRKDSTDDLTLSEIEKILTDPVLSNLKTITLTGGEPFERKDIVDICRIISSNCKELIQLYISTNGYESDYIFNQVKSILEVVPNIMRFRIAISFDNIGTEHDKVRGKKGIHENAITLVNKLRNIPDERISIQGNFTIGPYNINNLNEIYNYFEDIQLKIFWFPIMVSENFFENVKDSSNFVFSDDEISKLKAFINFLKKQENSLPDYYYYSGLYNSLDQGKRAFPCSGGSKFFQINSKGDVFPCYIIPKEFRFGNIREKSLEEIWYSERSQKLRANLNNCSTCSSCIQWYDGYALSDDFSLFLRFVMSHPLIIAKQLLK